MTDENNMTEVPLLTYYGEIAFKQNRPSKTVEDQAEYFNALASSFFTLFRGNPNGFYLRKDNGKYLAVHQPVTKDDWLAHLLNVPDSGILIVPLLPGGTCHWAVIDLDRHDPEQNEVDWPRIAQRITELNLPLIICRSTHNRGAWIFCFFRDKEGIGAADARRIMRNYADLLELGTGKDVEIFPKQSDLDGTAKGLGNGLNMPYRIKRGSLRWAYDAAGKQIEYWDEFLQFAWERSVFGKILLRDLPDVTPTEKTSAPILKSAPGNRPIKAAAAREEYEKGLKALRNAKNNDGNNTLFKTAALAGNLLAGLGKSRDAVKAEMIHIVTEEWEHPHPEFEAESTIESGLKKGLSEPRDIVLPVTLPWQNSNQPLTITKTPAIIENLIYAAASTALIGKVKLGKTTFCLDAAECVIYGRAFLKEPSVAGSVLYVSEQPMASFVAELRNSGLVEKGQLLLGEQPAVGQFEYICIEHWFRYSWGEIVDAVVEHAVMIGAKLVIFDTLSRIARIENENDAAEVQRTINQMTPFLERGIATLFVSHERKSGGDISDAGRGSSAIVGTVDVILRLTKPSGKHPETYRQLDFIGRFPGPGGPRVLERKTPNALSRYEVLGNVAAVQGEEAQSSILRVLEGVPEGYTEDEIVQETESKRTTVRREIKKMLAIGLVSQSGEGRKDSPYRYIYLPPPF